MKQVVRRSIDELAMRYKLEPSLKDVFVEGEFDKNILISSFGDNSKNDHVVYPIDTVDVPREILERYQLTTGNKQRVIALAIELSSRTSDSSYVCLIDRDLDHWFKKNEGVPRLKWTKYCSMECHYFSVEKIRYLLTLACRAKINDLNSYFSSVVNVLSKLYSFRLAGQQLSLTLRWIPISRYLLKKGSEIHLEDNKYVSSLLNANNMRAKKETFVSTALEWADKFNDDPRLFIWGHDFVQLLVWSIRNFKGDNSLSHEEHIFSLMIVSAKDDIDIRSEVDCESE